ncbi:MAG: protease inhibitor I42 family protein [Candidatus Acinetobacter avistercoris]|uniref:protease inhibitor I42 family protein n=1 Tax=Acinetobacter sp. KS-LM10 TaxID=3120518 RepID=UPI001FA12445|nr:protease inhibitor I42 family protein [Candidatus Acinetobacter avistercoris]
MKNLFCMTILFGGLILVGCQSSTPQTEGKIHHYTLNQKCPALMVMKVGETLVFNASENPSTGFQWQLLQPLKLFKVEESYLQTEAEEGMVGVGGEKSFRFKAEKPGQELIELVYARSWEPNKQAQQQWQCRIRIS